MSQTLLEHVRTAVGGRHKVSVWGIVPFPRRIGRPPKGFCVDPEASDFSSEGYERLARHRERQRPIEYPVQSHCLIEVEQHIRSLKAGLDPASELAQGLELVSLQADYFIGVYLHNPNNASVRAQVAAKAFREVWETAVARTETCPKCRETVRKRLALNGFVS